MTYMYSISNQIELFYSSNIEVSRTKHVPYLFLSHPEKKHIEYIFVVTK